uniref:Uncharacterized protein n=1 Tax=Faecalibaculum rodentium TaxID=1702221 RepID=A0A140DWX1_9FIRM|nr:hypothetical protein AALO17_20140 [Faecalibaculum rodentium]
MTDSATVWWNSEAISARQTLSQAIADSFIGRNRPERYKPATRQQPKTEYPQLQDLLHPPGSV